ncbi:hypothetical protein OFY17_08580 [Marinomonas sp. C2222]|uniref:Rap1a immunity protein domain-containing protein n=1 Tax=Marinomonas sargassi TaxID=2984494 RepID=A0ABT2YSR2_9GAMM|nr:hypothetical protein [Marinomonas sargassi]MCV2402934.1 hypothetical protein [Marinomonas sargassi]
MTLITRVVSVLLFMALSVNTFARNDIPLKSGSNFLISACQEVVDIYDARGEKKFLASQRTSLAEGIRTGYCLGVIAQYREEAGYCRYSERNVLEMATAIANSNLTAYQLGRTSTSELLEEAYCGL